MHIFKPVLVLLVSISFLFPGYGQDFNQSNLNYSLMANDSFSLQRNTNPFPYKSLFVPALMIAYGFSSLENPTIHFWDEGMKNEIYVERTPRRLNIDNYLQFAPAIAVYGLNLAGIKGKHNFRDRTMIYLLSNMIMGATVYTSKQLSHFNRPDGSNDLSFPSGHTAEAFVSAEFLRQEYQDVSPWYGMAGYAVAATTGYLRIHNNRHWLSDVIGGAGIGIASTNIAYWIYPMIQRKVFKEKNLNTLIMPTWQNHSIGLSMVHKF